MHVQTEVTLWRILYWAGRDLPDLGSSQSAQSGSQQQHGGAHTANNMDAFATLLNELQAGQSVLQNNPVQNKLWTGTDHSK